MNKVNKVDEVNEVNSGLVGTGKYYYFLGLQHTSYTLSYANGLYISSCGDCFDFGGLWDQGV